jgi:hypothetical protein
LLIIVHKQYIKAIGNLSITSDLETMTDLPYLEHILKNIFQQKQLPPPQQQHQPQQQQQQQQQHHHHHHHHQQHSTPSTGQDTPEDLEPQDTEHKVTVMVHRSDLQQQRKQVEQLPQQQQQQPQPEIPQQRQVEQQPQQSGNRSDIFCGGCLD